MMASRRTRIKGIANIPQRRKNNVSNENTELQVKIEENPSQEEGNLTFNIDKKVKDEQHPEIIENIDVELDSKNKDSKVCNEDISHNIAVVNNVSSIENRDINHTNEVKSDIESVIKSHGDHKHFQEIENKNNVPQTTQQQKPLLMRRKFIKPAVSASVINRKPKQNVEKELVVKTELDEAKKCSKEPEKSDKIIVLNNTIIPTKNTTDLIENQEVQKIEINHRQPIPTSVSKTSSEVTLDEVNLTSQNRVVSRPEVPLDNNVKKLAPYINIAHNSDTEYPPPPPSPSKINRSRIKAIPRLGYRKTSFSASESEDESRRNYNRNRNDSVCSTASAVPESVTECMSPQRPKEFNSIIQKKCTRTEQSRKLAEARREFQRRFGTNKPDRQRLTMIDLIFYNPSSNPMTDDSKPKGEKVEENVENVDTPMEIESEKIDDPEAENDERSDEESEMPVPQIKIGPSGEIILDEKSLVIESKKVAKQREKLQKTQLVNGDFDTGYGVYKRQKRAKDWTQSETLRFYKALNTMGTDFTLMCELFPRRTRRELKMKFKKEEKINKTLIDRALLQPCRFDYEDLKHEVDMEEKELEELRKQKEMEVKARQEKVEARLAKKRKASQEENSVNSATAQPPPPPPKSYKPRKPKMKKLNIESVLEDSDADESDIATQSESEDEVLMPLRPTRSGRVPKAAKKFDTTEPYNIETTISRNRVPESAKTNNIEPGSIMIITEKGQNGEPIYKIFMVTPDQNTTPLNLTSDVVSRAIEFKKGVTAQNIMTISANVTDDEAEDNTVVEENNITIPADENIKTLKGGNESELQVLERNDNVTEAKSLSEGN